jgi:hypothetical protein
MNEELKQSLPWYARQVYRLNILFFLMFRRSFSYAIKVSPTLVSGTLVLIDVMLVFAAYKTFILINIHHTIKENIKSITEALDPFSILLGMAAIVLSLVIFAIVKEETEKKDAESGERIKNLNTSVSSVSNSVVTVDNSVKQIDQTVILLKESVTKMQETLQDYSSLVPIKGLTKRLEKNKRNI